MADQQDLSQLSQAIDLPVDAPLALRVRPSGELEVRCYQARSDSTDALAMNLVFSRDAAGQLAALIRHALDQGMIVLEKSDASSLQ